MECILDSALLPRKMMLKNGHGRWLRKKDVAEWIQPSLCLAWVDLKKSLQETPNQSWAFIEMYFGHRRIQTEMSGIYSNVGFISFLFARHIFYNMFFEHKILGENVLSLKLFNKFYKRTLNHSLTCPSILQMFSKFSLRGKKRGGRQPIVAVNNMLRLASAV